MDPKKWYKSRTLWANVFMIVGSVIFNATGQDYLDSDTQVGLIGLVNMILRIITKTGLAA